MKKWNLYFLGFLREALGQPNFLPIQANFTASRHGQDTILNAGIEKPAETKSAHCYMEINANGKLNLKANLEALTDQEEKRGYVDRARRHYKYAEGNRWLPEATDEVAKLKKSRMLLSFDVGIEKQDKFFKCKSKERTCEQIRDTVSWFSRTPAVP